MFSVFSCLIFDFRLQSSNWFLLTFCPDVPWYQWRPLAEHYHQTPGYRHKAALPFSPFFSPFWQRPLTAESFWISAIMFSLCNPPHGWEKKWIFLRSQHHLSAFLPPLLSPPLSTPDVPYLPSKALGGCTINSCLVRGITKIISMDTPPSAESVERPFLSSKRSNYPMTSKTSDDIKQKDRRGTWLYSHLWDGVDKVGEGKRWVLVAFSPWPLQLTPPNAARLEIKQNLHFRVFISPPKSHTAPVRSSSQSLRFQVNMQNTITFLL